MSTITVTGRLTRDPELRYTPSGKALVQMGIAENHSRRKTNGDYEQTGTTFYNATRWAGQTSDTEVLAIAESLHKGDLVLIVGELRTRDYERDGETRRGTELVANDVAVLLRGQTVTVTRNTTDEQPIRLVPADSDVDD